MKTNIRIERARFNISQKELAEHVQVSRQTIHAIETRSWHPSVYIAIKIAKFFGVPVENFEEFNLPANNKLTCK